MVKSEKYEIEEIVEKPKSASNNLCSCGAAGCGGRDIFCKVHGKK